jgi:hypothetical protein
MMELFILLCKVGCYCVIGGVNVGCGVVRKLVVHWAKFFKKRGVLLLHKFLVLPPKNALVKQVCDCKKKFLTSKFYS